ncbi:MAG: TonB-dependent receptor, partial [bacterium]
MNSRRLLITLMIILLGSSFAFAQGLIRGVVQDVNTDETLIGATVLIRGTTIGVTTNLDGSFLLIAPEGDHQLVVSYVGYEEYVTDISVKDGSTYNLGTILMLSSSIGLQEINVFANVAIDRKTPVAVSTVDAATIVEQLGSQELPEVVNRTPSVYAVKQGGGFGDSRINIRGFDQRNIAIMVNGVPVNDMENGWVYWSNWAGLGDALRSIQIQRGLGASKLAINSVGGTMNMITKTTDANAGGSFQASVTDYGNTKMVLSLSTGKTKDGWALSLVGSRTFGPGYIDQTWVDAWSYFVSISKEWQDHLLTFTAIGAPQEHGQRSYTVSEGTFTKYGPKYNQHWGTYNGNVLMERENKYHKPQLALNWYWTINENSFLATSAYASFGKGYGTGTLDNREAMPRYRIGRTENGQIDWNGVAEENADHTDTAYFANGNLGYGGNIYNSEGEVVQEDAQLSKNILRESVNEHVWYGIISTFNHTFKNKSTLIAGLDGRTYVGKHFRRVRNLLG